MLKLVSRRILFPNLCLNRWVYKPTDKKKTVWYDNIHNQWYIVIDAESLPFKLRHYNPWMMQLSMFEPSLSRGVQAVHQAYKEQTQLREYYNVPPTDYMLLRWSVHTQQAWNIEMIRF